MRRSLDEKRVERALLARLRGLGCYAAHIDCGVDGFTDLVVGFAGAVVLVEVKDTGRGLKVKDLFEDTQPVFYEAWCKTGGFVYVVIGGGDKASLWKIKKPFLYRIDKPGLLISDVAILEAQGSLNMIAQMIRPEPPLLAKIIPTMKV